MANPLASLLPNGKQTFIDQNGVPLIGGSVYFYIPNTTTPKNTWQDSQELTLNTNPVVLDSYGSAIIYGSGQYRQIVKDILGNTIWDQSTTDLIGVFGNIVFENIGGNLTDDGAGNLVSKITTSQNIVAASTTDLGSLSTDVITITGSTGITSFGSSATGNNPLYFIRFSAAPLLTYNATSMILPGQANIQVAAGDTAVAQYLGGSNWKVISYNPISGQAVIPNTSGRLLNIQVFTANGTYTKTTGVTAAVIYGVAGGGGGGGSGTSGNTAGGNGGNTSVGSLLVVNGGTGGAIGTGASTTPAPSAGGTVTTATYKLPGSSSFSTGIDATAFPNGVSTGPGGFFGAGGGLPSVGGAGGNGSANTGAGGASGGGTSGTTNAGSSGGSGGMGITYATGLSGTYTVTIGAAGTAGGAGSGGFAGGAGGSGGVIIFEYS